MQEPQGSRVHQFGPGSGYIDYRYTSFHQFGIPDRLVRKKESVAESPKVARPVPIIGDL
ncbi:hypothetical protein RCO48_13295 [Peribacillus frigoritolerans]|nr:hypothetical protein [Peribacillus frigoritolerans]